MHLIFWFSSHFSSAVKFSQAKLGFFLGHERFFHEICKRGRFCYTLCPELRKFFSRKNFLHEKVPALRVFPFCYKSLDKVFCSCFTVSQATQFYNE